MIPFPFYEKRFSFFVADHLLVGQLCTNPKSDRSLLSCLKVTQCSTSCTTSCHLTSSKSAWKSTPNCTWMCWRAWWSSGAIRWPVADHGCGSRTRRRSTNPKRPRFSFRRSATTLNPSLTGPLLPWPEPAELLRLVIRWEHHQHDLPQDQSQPDHRHPPSIRRAPAGACGKSMLSVRDPYRGGDWGWRRLHWIDVSSTT